MYMKAFIAEDSSLKKIKIAQPTDFSMLLGVGVKRDGKYFYKGSYVVKDGSKYESSINNGKDDFSYDGIRPACKWDEFSKYLTLDGTGFYWGEYPQDAVSSEMGKTLSESALPTGKRYRMLPTKGEFDLPEFIYDGKKYVRVPTSILEDSCLISLTGPKAIYEDVLGMTLPSGMKAIRGIGLGGGYKYRVDLSQKYIWFKVQPVAWVRDVENNIAVTEDIVLPSLIRQLKRNSLVLKPAERAEALTSIFIDEITPSSYIDLTQASSYGYGKSMGEYAEPTIISSVSKKKKKSVFDSKRKPKQITKKEDKPRQVRLYKKEDYELSFGSVTEEDIIQSCVESKIPVFLHGAPGVGKSARVKQIDSDCIRVYLRNTTPESLNGISVRDKDSGEMIDIPPTWYKKLKAKCEQEPDKTHVLFLDEISNALPSIQGMAFNIVLDREVNGIWKLPENCVTIAAGNDIEDSLAANEIAEPLFDRFAHVYIKSNIKSWLVWASKSKIHPAIYGFVGYFGMDVLRTKFDGKKPNADERKWEMASEVLYETGNIDSLRSLIGEELTDKFKDFWNMEIIMLDEVLDDEADPSLINSMSEKELCATVINFTMVDESELKKVRDFVSRYIPGYLNKFDEIWCGEDNSRIECLNKIKNGGRKL